MCCFSGNVPVHVSATNIFARMRERDGHQLLGYSMSLTVGEEVAMVLPLPVVSGSGDSAIKFIDLSSCADLFEELARTFMIVTRDGGGSRQAANLAVHRVGSFVASYVPTRADFSRLDPRFRIGDVLFDAVPAYADYGFAVFQLAPGASTIHPIGLAFPTRTPARLYFPTVHVHDGTFAPKARFDHSLYYQHPRAELDENFGDDRVSQRNVYGVYMGLVKSNAPVVRRTLTGKHPNADIWIDAA